ncbi:Alpha/Beta hydrolase protein [Mycena rosella]|uniref:Alpha/Beta hydrolase protein n=1 Tax=Mycena rosella TaxID=1033263 RepID=A0AAD7DR19_MYCRO|nr:Alpha/Beta hydrolase protein [Mycena rosella]
MDIVAQMQDTAIQAVLGPTFEAFVPLLEPKRAEITQARKTFRYGATERHQLDVYSPTTGNNHPILFFVYGGGFVTGERTLPAPADLCYGNLGLYFAQKGFVVVIPDYRLAPGTTFPGPVEDVRDALAWATSDANRAALGANADTNSVFFLGHSAGGVHALTLLLHAPVSPAPRPTCPHQGRRDRVRPAPLRDGHPCVLTDAYYGSAESTAAHAPFSLLRAAPPELLAGSRRSRWSSASTTRIVHGRRGGLRRGCGGEGPEAHAGTRVRQGPQPRQLHAGTGDGRWLWREVGRGGGRLDPVAVNVEDTSPSNRKHKKKATTPGFGRILPFAVEVYEIWALGRSAPHRYQILQTDWRSRGKVSVVRKDASRNESSCRDGFCF